MAHCYKFAVVRLAPQDSRDERINLGIIVFSNESLDVRVNRRLDKVRILSNAIDMYQIKELIGNIKNLDEQFRNSGVVNIDERLRLLGNAGPISFSQLGQFVAEDANAYEARIKSIVKTLIDPEVASRQLRDKRSNLLAQMKCAFREERVLAKRHETLNSHRILTGYPVDNGLIADMVLKNGAMHIIETVDASGHGDTIRRTVAEIAVSALVIERARIKFGEAQTKGRIVYFATPELEQVALPSLQTAQHRGAELINWASMDDRQKFIHALSSLATPSQPPRRRRSRQFSA